MFDRKFWFLNFYYLCIIINFKQLNAISFYKLNCSDLTSNPSINIKLIGLYRNYLIIIDQKFWIFEIERTLFTSNDFRVLFNKMYMKMPIEKRWPQAFQMIDDKNHFEKIKNKILFGWIWSEYNLTFSFYQNGHLNFFSYDLAFDQWNWNVNIDKALKNVKTNNDLIFISNMSSNRQRLWLIHYRQYDHQILMARYDNLSQWYFLCSADIIDDGRHIDNVTFSNNSCQNKLMAPMALDDQPIIKAFQTHARIFFLTNQYVYFVSSLLLRKKTRLLGLRFPMKRKNLNELLICEPSIIQLINDNRMYLYYLSIFLLLIVFMLSQPV